MEMEWKKAFLEKVFPNSAITIGAAVKHISISRLGVSASAKRRSTWHAIKRRRKTALCTNQTRDSASLQRHVVKKRRDRPRKETTHLSFKKLYHSSHLSVL